MPGEENILSPKAIGSEDRASGIAAKTSQRRVSSQWRSFVAAICALAIAFAFPLYRLARFAWSNELYSFILLIPFISLYLVRLKKDRNLPVSKPWRGASFIFLFCGALVLGYWLFAGGEFEVEDGLALAMLSFILFLFGSALFFLGKEIVRNLAFPFGMLVFMVPMPVMAREGIETFLQYGSAYCAHAMFWISGTSFTRNDLIFDLSVLQLQVAPECSGIHSTLILFITSLLAGYLFLRSPWKRALLTFAVIPLGLLRNGFRVFTIGQLCIHFGPKMIDSVIHRKGGPLFFALSLIPFFALLAFLYRRERHPAKTVKS